MKAEVIYTSKTVIKLNIKRPQLWIIVHGYEKMFTFIVYPDNKVYRYNDWYNRWQLNKKFEMDRDELEKYGEFVSYI